LCTEPSKCTNILSTTQAVTAIEISLSSKNSRVCGVILLDIELAPSMDEEGEEEKEEQEEEQKRTKTRTTTTTRRRRRKQKQEEEEEDILVILNTAVNVFSSYIVTATALAQFFDTMLATF